MYYIKRSNSRILTHTLDLSSSLEVLLNVHNNSKAQIFGALKFFHRSFLIQTPAINPIVQRRKFFTINALFPSNNELLLLTLIRLRNNPSGTLMQINNN